MKNRNIVFLICLFFFSRNSFGQVKLDGVKVAFELNKTLNFYQGKYVLPIQNDSIKNNLILQIDSLKKFVNSVDYTENNTNYSMVVYMDNLNKILEKEKKNKQTVQVSSLIADINSDLTLKSKVANLKLMINSSAFQKVSVEVMVKKKVNGQYVVCSGYRVRANGWADRKNKKPMLTFDDRVTDSTLTVEMVPGFYDIWVEGTNSGFKAKLPAERGKIAINFTTKELPIYLD